MMQKPHLPERVWATRPTSDGFINAYAQYVPGHTEYVRADLYNALVEAAAMVARRADDTDHIFPNPPNWEHSVVVACGKLAALRRALPEFCTLGCCPRCGATDWSGDRCHHCDHNTCVYRLQVALRAASELVDELNGIDIHETAYAIKVERTCLDDGGEVTPDDYAEAFVRAANAPAKMPFRAPPAEPS